MVAAVAGRLGWVQRDRSSDAPEMVWGTTVMHLYLYTSPALVSREREENLKRLVACTGPAAGLTLYSY
jgi:hypothetical protein